MTGGDFEVTVESDGAVTVDTGGEAVEQIAGSEWAPPEPAENDNNTAGSAANDN